MMSRRQRHLLRHLLRRRFRIDLMTEMAKADGFVDTQMARLSPRTREIYAHYSLCFLVAIQRLLADEEPDDDPNEDTAPL